MQGGVRKKSEKNYLLQKFIQVVFIVVFQFQQGTKISALQFCNHRFLFWVQVFWCRTRGIQRIGLETKIQFFPLH